MSWLLLRLVISMHGLNMKYLHDINTTWNQTHQYLQTPNMV